jgi:hypothetical protein
MGNYIKYFFPCLKCKNRFNTKKVDEVYLDEDSIDIKNVTKNEFYCPDCEGDEGIPEILKIHSDNGKIEFYCLRQKKEFDISFEEYCDKVKQRTEKKCDTCIKKQLPEPNIAKQLCLGCQNYYCIRCGIYHINSKNEEKDSKQKTILTKFIHCLIYVLSYIPCLRNKLRDKDEHKLIYIKQISSYCLLHKLKTSEICLSCEKNVCEECIKDKHKWHYTPKMDLSCKGITNMILSCSSPNEEKILQARKTIFDKGQKLLKMKEFYEMIKSTYNKNKNIKIYKDNLRIVSKCIENEKKRDNKEADLVFYKLEQMRNVTNKPNNSKNENNDDNSKKENDINEIKDYA